MGLEVLYILLVHLEFHFFLGGGEFQIFGEKWEYLRSHAFARGFGGMLPRDFFKIVQFGAF